MIHIPTTFVGILPTVSLFMFFVTDFIMIMLMIFPFLFWPKRKYVHHPESCYVRLTLLNNSGVHLNF